MAVCVGDRIVSVVEHYEQLIDLSYEHVGILSPNHMFLYTKIQIPPIRNEFRTKVLAMAAVPVQRDLYRKIWDDLPRTQLSKMAMELRKQIDKALNELQERINAANVRRWAAFRGSPVLVDHLVEERKSFEETMQLIDSYIDASFKEPGPMSPPKWILKGNEKDIARNAIRNIQRQYQTVAKFINDEGATAMNKLYEDQLNVAEISPLVWR